MSDWDKKADDGAIKHYSDWCPKGTLESHRRGAKWQRDQLRTDEAVEKLADHLYRDEYGHPMAEHHVWCQVEDCTNTEDFRDSARAAITALLREES